MACQPSAAVSSAAPPKAKIQIRRGALYCRLGRYTEGRALIEPGLAILRQQDQRPEVAFALSALGSVAYVEAETYHAESLRISSALDDRRGIAQSLHNLGMIAEAQGQYQIACQRHEQSLAARQSAGDYLQRALQTALDIQATPAVLPALVAIAELRADAAPEQALDLLATVLQHPTCKPALTQQAEQTPTKLRERLPADIVAAAYARQSQHTLQNIAAELIRAHKVD